MRFPLQKTEELGIDRPTFIWALNLSYRGDRGAAAEPGDLTSVYGTVPGRWLPMAAAARGAGLAEERVRHLVQTDIPCLEVRQTNELLANRWADQVVERPERRKVT